jgi:4-aminobutyrate aminotransferase-like enzyme
VKGRAVGIEVGDEDIVAKLRDRCRRRGLLISAEDDVAMVLPALTIDENTAKQGLDIFESRLPAASARSWLARPRRSSFHECG